MLSRGTPSLAEQSGCQPDRLRSMSQAGRTWMPTSSQFMERQLALVKREARVFRMNAVLRVPVRTSAQQYSHGAKKPRNLWGREPTMQEIPAPIHRTWIQSNLTATVTLARSG